MEASFNLGTDNYTFYVDGKEGDIINIAEFTAMEQAVNRLHRVGQSEEEKEGDADEGAVLVRTERS